MSELLPPRIPYKVYVSGPMRGYPGFNFDLFDEATAYLVSKGYDVFNPAAHDRETWPDIESWPGFAEGVPEKCPKFDLEIAMAWDLARVRESDAIVLLPGYHRSSGARREIAEALYYGKRFISYVPASYVGPGSRLAELSPDAVQDTLGGIGLPAYARPDFTCEVIVTDPKTGGMKGQKPCQLGFLDPLALMGLGDVAGYGATKYEKFNYLKGYDWSSSYHALQRHAMAFWLGEDNDPESGLPHAAHLAWHALALYSFSKRGLGTDDRPKFNQNGGE